MIPPITALFILLTFTIIGLIVNIGKLSRTTKELKDSTAEIQKLSKENLSLALWKETLSDVCAVYWSGWYEDSPNRTIDALLKLEGEMSVDPLISKPAQDLIDRGRSEVLDQLIEFVSKVHAKEALKKDSFSIIEEIILHHTEVALTVEPEIEF